MSVALRHFDLGIFFMRFTWPTGRPSPAYRLHRPDQARPTEEGLGRFYSGLAVGTLVTTVHVSWASFPRCGELYRNPPDLHDIYSHPSIPGGLDLMMASWPGAPVSLIKVGRNVSNAGSDFCFPNP